MPAFINKFTLPNCKLLLMLFGSVLAGCSSATAVTPTTVPAPSPGSQPAPENHFQGQVDFEGIHFSYDTSLASQITPAIISSRFGPDYAPWEQSPTQIAFGFVDPYTSDRQLYWMGFTPNPAPIIFIYRTSDFPEPVLGWDGITQVQALQEFLKVRPAQTEERIPLLPLTNAGQSFHAKLKYLEFNGGSGVRFITQYTQEQRVVNNQELIYTFQGLTSDGAYYISALLPVSAQTLPESHQVAEGEIPNFWAGFEKYLREAVAKVNGLPDEAFDPDLAILDTIFESLSFPYVSPTPTPPAQVPTPSPTPAVADLPDFIYPTPLPTLDAEYIEYRSPKYPVAFEIPSHWTKVADDHFQGPEGFFEIIPYEGPASGLMDPYSWTSWRTLRACSWELNSAPERYGIIPNMHMVSMGYGDARCIIFPGDGALDTPAVLLFQNYGDLAIVKADLRQMERIGDTFHYIEGYDINPGERPLAQGVKPELQPAADEPVQLGELILEEYVLFPAELQTPNEEDFPGALKDISIKRQAWREANLPVEDEERLAQVNLILAQNGLRLEPSSNGSPLRMRLFQDDKLLKEDLTFTPFPIVVSGEPSAPNRFAIILAGAENEAAWLLREDGIEPWDLASHLYATYPVFIEGNLATLEHEPAGLYSRLWVVIEGDKVYKLLYPYTDPSFISFNGSEQWVLEVDGSLIVDGKLANLDLGYGEIFGFTFMNGKPFFFFEKDGKFKLSYDGQTLPYEYDEVLHANCCGSTLNAQSNQNMAWFYGLRGGIWYYVELGRYD